MPLPDGSRPTKIVSFEDGPGGSITARVSRLHTDLASRIADTAWSALHALGAHRWRDGYETNADRGWSRYRGSRCTICDEPWEGW